MKTAAIILAGGQGTRMGASIPKQFLLLEGKPVALHSLQIFEQLDAIEQIVVVADPSYHSLFCAHRTPQFALPGVRRQDSLFNGLQMLSPEIELVCVHDAARPFITKDLVLDLLKAGEEIGAACAAIPVKFTVKEASADGRVNQTIDRSRLFEIQTPQVVRKDLLQKGFAHAQAEALTVTDDVSLVEIFHHPVQLINGNNHNIKITTPEDWQWAQTIARMQTCGIS